MALKHNYTNELELKSLLIRIKNTRIADGTVSTSVTNPRNDKETIKKNDQIKKYIKWYIRILNSKSKSSKSLSVQKHLKQKVVELSEKCLIDTSSYNRFGQIILLMINRIMTKPQFSGYTYKDDFTSDAVFKILKYLDNFDHTLISKTSGQHVNAFAYITQIIHNSIMYIINTKKAEQDFIKSQILYQRIAQNKGVDVNNNSYYNDCYDKMITLEQVNSVYDKCLSICKQNSTDTKILIEYQDKITDVDELANLRELQKQYKNLTLKRI